MSSFPTVLLPSLRKGGATNRKAPRPTPTPEHLPVLFPALFLARQGSPKTEGGRHLPLGKLQSVRIPRGETPPEDLAANPLPDVQNEHLP